MNSQHAGITNIRLRNFKCFDDLNLTCSTLNLLCGFNGSGKSTVLQSLLVLRQSWPSVLDENGRLRFSGPLVRLGSAAEVLREGSTTNHIEIAIRDSSVSGELRSVFKLNDAGGFSEKSTFPSDRESVIDDFVEVAPNDVWNDAKLFGEDFAYIEAGRIGPRISYPIHSEDQDVSQSHMGRIGVYAWDALWRNRRKRQGTHDVRNATKSEDVLLLTLVQDWMDEIAPGFNLQPK